MPPVINRGARRRGIEASSISPLHYGCPSAKAVPLQIVICGLLWAGPVAVALLREEVRGRLGALPRLHVQRLLARHPAGAPPGEALGDGAHPDAGGRQEAPHPEVTEPSKAVAA